MSRRSRRSRGVPKLQGIPLLLIQLLLGAVLAIAIGVLLGRLYINRVLDSPPDQETIISEPAAGEEEGGPTIPSEMEENNTGAATGSETTITRIPSLQLYRVQVGAFSQVENARSFLTQLEELGFEGIITGGGSIHRVSIGLFTDRRAAEELTANLVLLQDVVEGEPLVVAERLPQIDLTHDPRDIEYYQEIAKAIEKTAALASEMESLWLSYAAGEKTPAQVGAEADGIDNEITTLGAALQLAPPSTMSRVQEEVLVLPEDLAATLQELRKQVEGGGKWAPFPYSIARLMKIWPQLK